MKPLLLLIIFSFTFSVYAFETTIATFDFIEDNTSNPQYKGILADLLAVELSKNPDLKLLERAEMEKILKEHELAFNNPVNAIKTGNILGAEYILFGRVYSVEDETYINVKFINCKTGKINGTVIEKKSAVKNKDMLSIVKQIASFVNSTVQQTAK